jgi:predicted metal-binding membrane protein
VTDRRTALERALSRDRLPVLAALAGLTGLSWAYLATMVGGMHGIADAPSMPDMPDMAQGAMGMQRLVPWTAAHFGMMLGMWAVMMVGMMLPADQCGITTCATSPKYTSSVRPFRGAAVDRREAVRAIER